MADAGTVIAWVLFGIVAVLIIVGLTGVITPMKLEGGTCQFSDAVCGVFHALGTPDWFLSSKNFYWYFLAPIAVIGVVVYGFLDTLRLFRNRTVNILLAIFIALISIPTNVFTTFVATLMAILGTYSVSAFFIVFVVGVFFISAGTIRRVRGEFTPGLESLENKIRYKQDELRRLESSDLPRTNPVAYARRIKEINEELRDYESQKDAIKHLKKEEKI